MRRLLFPACAVLAAVPGYVLGAPERAEFTTGQWRTCVYAGWSDADLSQVADGLSTRIKGYRTEWLRDYGGVASGRARRYSGGITAGWEMGRRFSTNSGWGLRLEFLAPGDVTGGFSARGDGNEEVAESETITAALVPVMLGIWTTGGKPTGISVRGFLFAGPAFGSMTDRISREYYSPNDDEYESWASVVSASGLGYAAECGGELGYGMPDGLALFAGAAWRTARVGSMRYAASADFDGDGEPDANKGERIGNSRGDSLRFDFSGFQWTFGIRMAL